MTDWDLFVARLDPEAVELERFDMPHVDELPGSPADKRMRREHQALADTYWYRQRFPSASDMEVAAMLAESATYTYSTYEAGKYKRDRVRWRAMVAQRNNIETRAS